MTGLSIPPYAQTCVAACSYSWGEIASAEFSGLARFGSRNFFLPTITHDSKVSNTNTPRCL